MPRKTYTCDYCGQIFTNKREGLKHYREEVAEHAKPYEETKIHKKLQQEIESIRWNRSMMERDLAELKKYPHDTPTIPPCWTLRDPDFELNDEIESKDLVKQK